MSLNSYTFFLVPSPPAAAAAGAAAQQSFIADSFSCYPSVCKLLLGRGFVHLCDSGTELTKLRGQIPDKVPTSIFSSRLSGLK